MKELTIEEKAKRYDEAITRAKYYYDEGKTLEFATDIASDIFPELKESEDERIRKELIGYFTGWNYKHLFRGFKAEQILAWLEKQGEQKPIDKVEPKFKAGDIIRHKKQGFTCKIIAVDNEYRLSDCNGTHLPIEWQDAYELVEQKSAWGEEDENRFYNLIFLVERSNEGKATKEGFIKFINRLKSLRPQINVTNEELAQAKKDAYNDALDKIEYHSGEPTFDDGWSAAIDYIRKKSIRPQSTWKPSDEQMDALDEVYKTHSANNECRRVLFNLMNDLKKLMDE